MHSMHIIKLTWTEIVEYTTIAEFELLQCSACEDIHNLEWADARNNQATICHLKLIILRKRLIISMWRSSNWPNG